MMLTIFTLFHVAISQVGLLSGFVAVFGLLSRQPTLGVDGDLSGYHRSNERDRLLFSAGSLHARPRSRNRLVTWISRGDLRA